MKKPNMCARNNIVAGGGAGSIYSFGSAVAPGYAEVVRTPSCSGGRRRPHYSHTRSGRRHRTSWNSRTRRAPQRGGTYAANFDSSIVVGTRGAYMPIQPVSCAAQHGGNADGFFRPVTTGTCATQQRGGAGEAAEATTAGYSFSPSPFVGATGTPIALSLPTSGRSCGGRRRRDRKSRRGRKRN